MHFDVVPTTILLVVAGSHAYGTETDESDLDVRGICVAPLDIRLSSYKRFEQYEDKLPSAFFDKLQQLTGGPPLPAGVYEIDDVVIYDIAKAIKLMGDCNPNMLELLFGDEKDIVLSNEHGDRLRSMRDSFLSLKLKHTYTGYARAQLARIKRHRGYLMGGIPEKPTRKEYGLPEGEGILDQRESSLIDEEIKAKLLSWGIEDFEMTPAERDVLRQRMREFWSHAIHCSEEELDNKLEDIAAKSLGLTSEVREALSRERKYRAAMKGFKSYVKWKNERNPKRKELEEKYGFDCKHASHLIRIARMGVEILSTAEIKVKRPDAAELLGIRQGKRTFEDIVEETTKLEQQMDELHQTNPCGLPKKVDTDLLDGLTREIILMSLR